MLQSEKSVLLISNGQSTTEEKNTLTSFSGSIPPNFLDTGKYWKVAINSIGIHFLLKQSLSPKYENFPCLIQITYSDFRAILLKYNIITIKNFSLTMFDSALKLYIDRNKSYTSQSLVNDFQLQIQALYHKNEFQSMPLKYEQDSNSIVFGQFESDGSDSEERISNLPLKKRKNLRTVLFFNKYFRDGLDIQIEDKKWKTIHIDGQLYYYLFNSKYLKKSDIYPFKSKNVVFPINEPKIIRIMSPNIKHSINNTTFNQCLKEFSTKSSDIGKYIHKEFENFEFFDVLNNFVDSFEVKFVDENYQQLRLCQGLPSWVKLTFIPQMTKEQNVRISSEATKLHPENTLSDFNVELPKSLDFTWKKNPRVSLTRISFQNNWQLLPGLRLDFFIYNIGNDENKFQYFKCPKEKEKGGPASCEEIVNWFITKNKQENTSIRLARQGGNNHCSFIFNKKCIIIIGRDLAQCLGFSFVNQTLNNYLIRSIKPKINNVIPVYNDELDIKMAISEYTRNITGITMDLEYFLSTGDVIIAGEINSKYHLIFPPRNIEIYPNDLYLYCNIVEPTIVAGDYKQLLRIIPLPHDKQNQNITVDFQKPEFHELRELKPRILQFEIGTIDGKHVTPYNKRHNVYLNLQFDHE